MVGLSPKKLEIGGLAPTASPPDSVIDPIFGLRSGTQSNHGFRKAAPPIAKDGPRVSAACDKRRQLAMEVTDVQDRGFLILAGRWSRL